MSAEINVLFSGWWVVDGGWWMVDGGWGPTFWFFKSLDINMIYTLCLDVYVCIYKSVHNNFVMGLILLKSWRPHLRKSKSPKVGRFFKNHTKSIGF